MGNGNSTGGSPEYDVHQKLTNCYEITRGKEGFAVLVGSEPQGNGVMTGLSSMDSTLKKTCRVDTQAPFLSQSRINQAMPPFSMENFDKLCRLLFDKDMLVSLGLYSSFFFYFCGYGDDSGMITVDNKCIPYITMVKKVLVNSLDTRKPTVFIFDCHLRENTTVQMESIASSFTEQLGPAVSNTLICISFTSSAGSGLPPTREGRETTFTSELAYVIQQHSHLFSLTDLISLAGSRTQLRNSERFLGPLCLDYLNAQFMLIEDVAVRISQERQQWIDYCCTQIIDTYGNNPTISSDPAQPGLGHCVFVLFAYDSCGPNHTPPDGVYTLARSLLGLGFEVFCDSIGRTTPQRDWTRWYSICLSQCDNVVMVCSPLMNQVFSTAGKTGIAGTTSSSIPPPQANQDCVEVLSEVYHIVNNMAATKSTFQIHPVMVCSQYDHSCVPTLFAGQKLYHLSDTDFTAPFNSTHSSGNEYHSLVSCMAGQPSQPVVGKVASVPTSNDSMGQQMAGHRFVEEPFPNLTTIEDIKAYFYKPVKRGYKVVTRVTQTQLIPPPDPSRPLPPSYFNPPPVKAAPPPLVTPSAVVNLSQKTVSIQAMLWLSGKLVQWKFLGRKLGVEEFQLTRIEQENPLNISEQIYQTLQRWQNNSIREQANYEVLANAVESAEGKKMKEEFLDFVISSCLDEDS